MIQQEPHSYWRSDITGLRALAVLPVLFFHAWPNLLPGGFVGVDVFFVISGYLISGILFRQLQKTGAVHFGDFYAKRIRRIIPNLLCVLIFTMIVGCFFLTPGEFHDLGKQIYSSTFFYQNFRLLKELGDYFAVSAAQQPLLHLWSLAIEEQFYIVFPLLCALVWKLRSNVRAMGVMVAAVTFGSFAACLLVKDQSFRFYFPLTRSWELGVGILLSYAQHFGFWRPDSQSVLKRNVLSLLGGGILIVSLFVVREENFPGPETLMPTLGALLILSASPKAHFNKLLAWGPIVFIGLISYSLYLWHWPLLAYANIIAPVHAPWWNGVMLAVAFLLSVAAYRYVETPFRTVRQPQDKKRALVVLIVGLLAVTGLGQWVRHEDGLPQRTTAFMRQVELLREDWPDRDLLQKVKIGEATVEMNREAGFPEILFIGDSHMEQYIYRIVKDADERNRTVGILVEGGCWVAPGVLSEDQGCSRVIRDFEHLIQDPRIKHVVLAQKWGGYLDSNKIKFRDESGKEVSFADGGWKLAIQSLKTRFEGTGRTLHVILDVPWDESETHSNYDPLRRFTRFQTTLNEKDFLVPLPGDTSWSYGNDVARSVLGPVATIVEPAPIHCPEGRCNLLNYKDDDHLRASYAKDHAVWIDSIFEDLKGASDESKDS